MKEAALAATRNDLCELRRLGAKRPERAGPGAAGPGPALLFGRPGAALQGRPRLPNAAAPRGPAPSFLRPRERWDFPPSKGSIRQPFPARKPTHKTSPPLPMSGGPAYAVGKPKKDSSQFSPAFLKAGGSLGAEPPTGSRGSAPGGVRGRAPAAGRCKKRTTR